MNKKKLLLVLLTLAIVTSLSAGTLAVYTTTADPIQGSVQIKKFVFTAAGTSGDSTTVKLAPKDVKDYTFTVSNADGSAVAEVPLDYTISIDYSSARSAMPGLKADLISGSTTLKSDVSGSFSYTVTNVPAGGEGRTDSYVLRLTWADSTDSAQTTAGENAGDDTYPMVINISATQNTSAE